MHCVTVGIIFTCIRNTVYSDKHHRAVDKLVAELDSGQLLMTALQTHEVLEHVNLEAMLHAKELSVDVINKIFVRNVVQLTKNGKTNSDSSQNLSSNIGELSEVVTFQPLCFFLLFSFRLILYR